MSDDKPAATISKHASPPLHGASLEAYIEEQDLESTITEAVKQVVYEKPTNAVRRLGELLTEKAEPPLKHHAVMIIGGGVGGLYTALRLLEETPGMDVQLFESRGMLGGRVQTTRDGEGKPLFNDFAWRVGETNTEMIKLAKELDITLIKQFTPPPEDCLMEGSCESGSCNKTHQHEDGPIAIKGRAPLSAFASFCIDSTSGADQHDRESGYAGRMAQISFPGEAHGNTNYYVANGMGEYPEKLAAKLPHGVVHKGHRCTDVSRRADGKYLVQLIMREGDNYTPKSLTCDTLVLAVPPFALRSFSVAKELAPVLFAIQDRRNTHVYAKSSSPGVPDTSTTAERVYKGFPESLLQQFISGDYGNGIFQAGYACDRFERVWRELQFQGPDVVREQVQKQFARLDLPSSAANLKIDEVYLRAGWVHRWQIEAHVNGKTKEELQAQAVYPSPVRLPGLYLVGEAFSSQQGWTEGALLTAMAVVEHILHSPDTSASKYAQPMDALVKEKGGKTMVYRGLVLDVSEWSQRHPGGFGPIHGHGGETIDHLFDSFHAGCPAPLATLFGLQCGVVKQSDDEQGCPKK